MACGGTLQQETCPASPLVSDAVLVTRLKLIPQPAIVVRLVRYCTCSITQFRLLSGQGTFFFMKMTHN